MIFKLVLATFIGALFGLEREIKHHPAGLRTHILVSLGSAIFMIMAHDVGDPARVAAGVVTGIGFLGAGAIMKGGSGVRGLTTAASIWITSALGVCVGTGLVLLAVSGAVIGLSTLIILNRVEIFLKTKTHRGLLVVKGEAMVGVPSMVNDVLERNKIWIEYSKIERDGRRVIAEYRIDMPMGESRMRILQELTKNPEIKSIEWD